MILTMTSSLLLLVCAGFSVAVFFDKERVAGFAEKFALAFGLGSGLVVQIMLVMFLSGSRFNIIAINSMIGIVTLVLLFSSRNRLLSAWNKMGKPDIIETMLVLMISAQIVFVFAEALIKPVYTFDAMANWAWKAKVFSFNREVLTDKADPLFMGGYRPNYPLHMPFVGAWMDMNSDGFMDNHANLIPFSYFLFFLILFYANARKYADRKKSLIFTWLLSSAPLVAMHGFNFYSDLPLAFYLTFSVVYGFNYLKNRNNFNLIMALIFSGLMTFVKNGGLIFSIIVLGALLAIMIINKYKDGIVSSVAYSPLYLLSAVPWAVYKYTHNFGYGNVGTDIKLAGTHPEIFKIFFQHLFYFDDFSILFLAVPVFLFVYKERLFKNYNYYLLAVLMLVFMVIMGNFFIGESYQYILDGTLDGRQLLAIFPLSIFLIGALMENEEKI